MASISVALLPVGMLPFKGDELRMLVYCPRGGAWLSKKVKSGEDPATVAAELGTAIHESMGDLTVEPVAFLTGADELTLVFTAVLPLNITLSGIESQAPATRAPRGWEQPIAFQAKDGTGRVTPPTVAPRLVLNYWRRQLQETTAAFEFLPSFFTTSQVRAVYSSIWGEEQNAGSFHRWLHKSNAGVTVEVPADQVRKKVDHAFEGALKGTALGLALRDAAALLSKGSVGASPFAIGTVGGAAAAAFPLILPALGAAAGLIAYQSRIAPGPQPDWYQRARGDRVLLANPYPARPKWLSTGEVPDQFH